MCLFLPLFFLFAGCTSVRPIVKIGLVAPFEGLYRESGYAALGAMRQALADCTPAGLDVLPLAVDDSGDPAQAQRAVQKLLADPTVHAIVGPLLLDTVPAVTQVITQGQNPHQANTHVSGVPLFVPSLVAPEGGFADAHSSDAQSSGWLEAQVDFVAKQTAATRVLLLGLSPRWELQVKATVPLLRVDDLDTALATVGAGDALVWLGRPDVGARWLSALRVQQPNVDFWLADQAGIDVFVAHTADLDAVHWLLWSDFNYNQWSQLDDSAIMPSDNMRYLVYRATCAALDTLVEAPSVNSAATTAAWELQGYPIERPSSE